MRTAETIVVRSMYALIGWIYSPVGLAAKVKVVMLGVAAWRDLASKA